MIKTDKGFTLVEFLVAFVVSTLLATGLYIAYRSNYRTFNVNQDILEMQMNARIAVDTITRSLRLVGFGSKKLYETNHPEGTQYYELEVPDSSFGIDFSSKLIFFKPGISSNTTTDARSDAIAITYASRYIGKITNVIDENTVILDDTSRLSTNATKYQKYNIYIYPNPYQENQKLLNLAGNTLTFTGRHHASIDDECYLLTSNYIHIVDNNLRIDHNIAPSSANNDIADNIEAFQLQIALDTNNNGVIESSEWQNTLTDQEIMQVKGFKIFILAKTKNPDPDFTDKATYIMADQTFGPYNDHFHRLLLTTTVIPRNLTYKD